MSELRIRDDFAGPGGWSQALASLQMEELGVENDLSACQTAEKAGHRRVQMDVRDVRGMSWGPLYGYIGSPPCQTFSAAGHGEGRHHLASLRVAAERVADGDTPEGAIRAVSDAALDERSVLVLEPLLVVRDWRPTWVALEQVPPVLPIWQVFAEIMRGWGYSVWTGFLQAEQYGVPQTRKRAILMAHREREIGPPAPTHSRYHSRSPEKLDLGLLKWISMAEALGWGMEGRPSPTITGGGVDTGGAEPIAKLARYVDRPDWVQRSNYSGPGRPGETAAERGLAERPLDVPSFAITSKGFHWQFAGAGRTAIDTAGQIPRTSDEPAHTITGKGTAVWQLATGTRENAALRSLDEPSPTLAFGNDAASYVWAPPGVRSTDLPRLKATGEAVRVTPAEAGVLQTFPYDYPWQGNKSKQYQQVGNAIPPLLARAILTELTKGTDDQRN